MPAVAIPLASWAASAVLAVAPAATGLAAATGNAILALGGAAGLGSFVSTWGTVLSLASAFAMKSPKPQSSGIQLDLKALGDEAPIPVAFGRTATGGYMTYQQVWKPAGESKNLHLTMISILSAGGPVQEIESIHANSFRLNLSGDPLTGQRTVVSLTPTDPDSKLFKDDFHVSWRYGLEPENGSYSEYTGQPLPGITTSHKLSGLASSCLTLNYRPERFAGGIPDPTWVLKGVRLYDPRKDSTYPGGSGAHRRGDPTTWEFSENPYIAALSWCLGRYANYASGSPKKVWGIGALWDEIDVPAFVHGANVADANGWKVGGVVTTQDEKFAVLGSLLQAGGGVPISMGARLSVFVNEPKIATFTINPDDIVGNVEITNTTPWRERKNRILPKYRSEAKNWEIVTSEAVAATTYIAEDGEVKSTEVTYPLVQDSAQVKQIASYDLVNTREFLEVTVTVKPRALGVRVGEALIVNAPDAAINGLKFIVVGRSLNTTTLEVTLNLRSETDAKHPWALNHTSDAPGSPSLNPHDPTIVPAPQGGTAAAWAVVGVQITTDSGEVQPGFIVVGAADDPTAHQVVCEYREYGQTEWTAYSETPATTTRRIEITGVKGGHDYEIAISYRNGHGVVGQRLILGPYQAGITKIDWENVNKPNWILDALAWFDAQGREIIESMAADLAAHGERLDALEETIDDLNISGAASQEDLRKQALAGLHQIAAQINEVDTRKGETFWYGRPLGGWLEQTSNTTNTTAETLSIVGVRTPDGAGFVLDRDRVIYDAANGTTVAGKFSQVESQTNSAIANTLAYVDEVAEAQTSNSTALANAIQSLGTVVNDNKSAAETAIQLLTTNAASQASSLTSLGAQVANSTAGWQANVALLVTNAASQASSIEVLGSSIADSTAGWMSNVGVLTTEIDALAEFQTLLGVKNGNSTGIILDTSKVYTNATTTLAQQQSLTEARFNGTSNSSLLTQITAAASNAAASFDSLTRISVNTPGSTNYQIDAAKVLTDNGQTLNQRITSVTSTIPSTSSISATAYSRIQTEMGSGGLIGSAIIGVENTAEDAQSSATLALTAAQGNGSQAVLSVTSGNRVTGFRVNGSTGDFTVQADRFAIVNSTGGTKTVPFLVSGGTVYMDNVIARNIGADTITANQIVSAGITTPFKAQSGSGTITSGQANMGVGSGFTSGDEDAAYVTFLLHVYNPTSVPLNVHLDTYRFVNGSPQGPLHGFGAVVLPGVDGHITAQIMDDDIPPNSSISYQMVSYLDEAYSITKRRATVMGIRIRR